MEAALALDSPFGSPGLASGCGFASMASVTPSLNPEVMLASALSGLRNSVGHTEIDYRLNALARSLGTAHPKCGTRAALSAVLAMIVWPGRFSRDQDALEFYRAKRTNFGKWKRRVYALPCLSAVSALLSFDPPLLPAVGPLATGVSSSSAPPLSLAELPIATTITADPTVSPSIGYANVAFAPTAPSPAANHMVASLSPRPADVVASHDGVPLHLSLRSSTGYERVSFVSSRKTKPYRAKAANGKLLGYFATPIDAAVCYVHHVAAAAALNHVAARDMGDQLTLADTTTTPSGEIIRLHLSPNTLTGYQGVHLLSGNRVNPYEARLGPSAADRIGHYPSAIEAAAAVACAIEARDALACELSHDLGPNGSELAPKCMPSGASAGVQPCMPLETGGFNDLDIDSLLHELPSHADLT